MNTHVRRMEEIRVESGSLVQNNSGLREELMRTIEYLKGVKRECESIKGDVNQLQVMDRQMKEKITAVETTYFVERKEVGRRATTTRGGY